MKPALPVQQGVWLQEFISRVAQADLCKAIHCTDNSVGARLEWADPAVIVLYHDVFLCDTWPRRIFKNKEPHRCPSSMAWTARGSPPAAGELLVLRVPATFSCWAHGRPVVYV